MTSSAVPEGSPREEPRRILRPDTTCEGPYRAARLAVLVDGEAYFGAVAEALERARQRVFLVGWDFHTGVRLRRGGGAGDEPDLVGLLRARLAARPDLEVRILEWDFALFYALERQLLPKVRFGAPTHPRLHFALDGTHATGASHHQKLVIVDDGVAFTGGFDLAPTRWDTRAHRAHDPRREDPGAGRYPPFHDVGVAVDGEAARALAAVARERWHRATGEALPGLEPDVDPWPQGLAATFEDVSVGLARTDPGATPPRREVEALHLESIRSARRAIYAESQYLTGDAVADALASRLRDTDGPDVVIVGPRCCSGWLEESVMGTRRARLVERLRSADRFGRLRLVHPVVPGVDPDDFRLHAKVTVVDDRLLRIGSANLSNRSMGLDTELDLAVEAEPGSALARRIEAVRDDLLAEHLGCEAKDVAAAVHAEGSLARGLDALSGGERTLVRLESPLPEGIEDVGAWIPEDAPLDPERPVEVDEFLRRFLPEQPRSPARRRAWLAVGGVALALAVLAGLWQFTPLQQWARPDTLAALAAPLRESAWGPWVFIAGMTVAGLAMVPVTALIVASALLFGPVLGFVVAWVGAMASALLGYAVGRGLWRDAVHRLLGPRLRRAAGRMGRRGAVAVAALRVVPVAPYTAVNVAAGASPLRLRPYAVGTMIGMTPGIALLTVLADRLARAVRDPGPGTVLGALVLVFVAWGGLRLLRRHLEARESQAGPAPEAQPEEGKAGGDASG